MKKFLPFVFPLVALLIVLFLAVRWYNTKTVHSDENKIADFGAIKVDDLSQLGKNGTPQMAKDLKTVALKGVSAQGEVRYDVVDNKLQFTVSTDLPQIKTGTYQVWLKQANGEARKKAFALTYSKGGYVGSAEVSADALPFDIVVSKKLHNDDTLEEVLMMGTIPAENTR